MNKKEYLNNNTPYRVVLREGTETLPYSKDRLQEMEQNFAFCKWEPYIGTAPEQKAKSAKRHRNSIFPWRFINVTTSRVAGNTDPYINIINVIYYKSSVFLPIY